MFRDQQFYHSTIRKLVTAFGQIFSGIQITRKLADNTESQMLEVPIGYGPKNKWLSIINEDPDKTNNVETILPRLAFEITSYQYDPARKIGTPGANILGTIGENRVKLFNPVPYNVGINLYSLAKTQNESLQILEQIVPYFSPQIIVGIDMLEEFNIVKEVPIVLNGVSVVDSYQGDMNEYRTVEQTFSFTAKIDLFGPINQSGKTIKEVIVDLNTTTNKVTQSPKYDAVVNPRSANKNDTYTIDESWGFK
jgi:hypothetical protein